MPRNIRTRTRLILVAISLANGVVCGSGRCQSQMGRFSLASARSRAVDAKDPSAIIREIDDPSTGVRWALERDPTHPGGPGLLRQMQGSPVRASSPGQTSKPGQTCNPGQTSSREQVGAPPRMPEIRAGDRIMIEEESATATVHLVGVAVGPASIGSDMLIRLFPGGSVLHAVAQGPGRATLSVDPRSAFGLALPPAFEVRR
jgi:hypothetical protein